METCISGGRIRPNVALDKKESKLFSAQNYVTLRGMLKGVENAKM